MSEPDELAGDEPREWIFTFGGGHVHPATGDSLSRRFVRLAGTKRAARERMVALFGVKWSHQYDAGDGSDPAGVSQFELVELPPEQYPPPAPRPSGWLSWRGVRLKSRYMSGDGQCWHSADDCWKATRYDRDGVWYARLRLSGYRVAGEGATAFDALDAARAVALALRRQMGKALPK